ncbi:MAG: class I SAM-dependent methyltransferase [Actinomycetota bacterium]|nr:class I SAM-dependent methyltransferase [Actinomycetota bacterium]
MSEHAHDHDHPDLADLYTQETWDARYAESERIWSGHPNPRLVDQVADLPPGDALDLGCGEGADAVWLATRGWRVAALDVSQVALERTAAHAREAGVADRVTALHHDLIGDGPLAGEYDLVSMQFMHPPPDLFDEFHRRVGAAVRPGGTLLVVGHHPDDVATGVREPHGPDLLFTPERVVEALDPEEWEIRVADAMTREQVIDERAVTVTDTVVVAVRR